MTQNNNLSPLPFYESINEQDFRKPWAFGEVPCLAASCEKLLPFFFSIPNYAGASISSVNVVDFRTKLSVETNLIAYVEVASLGQMKTVYYAPQKTAHSFNLEEGRYYIEITVNFDNQSSFTYYSEVFTAIRSLGSQNDYDLPGYMKITWYDNRDFDFIGGFIPYSYQYKNWIYLHTDVGMPDYIYDEEATDRDGFVFTKKQISEKRYKFSLAKVPEYMLDAMRVIRLSDNIIVQDVLRRKYNCDTFLLTPSWLDQGHYASALGEFDTDAILKKISGGYIDVLHGDFNNDFNNDFNII